MCVYLQSQMRETNNRGVAQLASASGLGPEGPVFESQYPDKKSNLNGCSFFCAYFDIIDILGLSSLHTICCQAGAKGASWSVRSR